MTTLLLALFLAWQNISPEAMDHIRAGSAALEQGRKADAVSEFRKVTELAPGLPAAWINLGNILMQTGDYAGAIDPLKRGLELNPELLGAHQMLGYALLSAGYAAEAIPHLEKSQTIDALGVAQLKAGKLTEAIGNLQAALAKRPGDPDLLYYLGRASGLLSRQAFETLKTVQPDSARTHQIMAETYEVLRNVPGAEKEYRDALRLRPETPGLHLGLGDLYAAAAQWDKAETEFRAEAKLQPGDGEAAFKLGNALLQEGKVKDAHAELARSDRLTPGLPETLYALGKAASLDGDKAGAEKAWVALVAIDNESPLAGQAHFGLAGIYRAQGNAAKAEAEMKEFERLRPGAPAR